MLMMPPAVSSPHGSWYSPTIRCQTDGPRRCPGWWSNISANKNSFRRDGNQHGGGRHARAGEWQHDPQDRAGARAAVDAPRVLSSGGMLSKKPLSIQMLTGVRKAV